MAGCMYKRAAELYPAYTVTGYGAGGRGVGGTRGVQRAAAQRRSTTYYGAAGHLALHWIAWYTETIETLARCNSWLVDVVKEKYGRL